MYGISVLDLFLAGIAGVTAIGGTTALALLILTFTRCEVTRWHIQRALTVARRQPFTEPRPTDCGCRRCARYRRRRPPAPPLPHPQPPPWPPKPYGPGEVELGPNGTSG